LEKEPDKSDTSSNSSEDYRQYQLSTDPQVRRLFWVKKQKVEEEENDTKEKKTRLGVKIKQVKADTEEEDERKIESLDEKGIEMMFKEISSKKGSALTNDDTLILLNRLLSVAKKETNKFNILNCIMTIKLDNPSGMIDCIELALWDEINKLLIQLLDIGLRAVREEVYILLRMMQDFI
jgi:hypothetical protein